jgi:hypothetical protein
VRMVREGKEGKGGLMMIDGDGSRISKWISTMDGRVKWVDVRMVRWCGGGGKGINGPP